MTLRRVLPVAIALSIFAGLAIVVAVLVARSKDDEYYIAKAARRIAIGKYDAQKLREDVDYKLAAVKIYARDPRRAVVGVVVARQGPTDTLFWELERGGEDWVVGRDLQEHFSAFMQTDAYIVELRGRFDAAIKDRYRQAIEVDTSSYRFRVAEQELDKHTDVIATTDFLFKAGMSKCRYVETWRYTDRSWKVDGVGRVFEGL